MICGNVGINIWSDNDFGVEGWLFVFKVLGFFNEFDRNYKFGVYSLELVFVFINNDLIVFV